jgi:hypothetical protein
MRLPGHSVADCDSKPQTIGADCGHHRYFCFQKEGVFQLFIVRRSKNNGSDDAEYPRAETKSTSRYEQSRRGIEICLKKN